MLDPIDDKLRQTPELNKNEYFAEGFTNIYSKKNNSNEQEA